MFENMQRLMKSIIFSVLFIGLSISYGQIYCKSLDSKTVQNIRDNGIVYVINYERQDSIISATLEDRWTATPFKRYNPETDGPMQSDQLALFYTTTSHSETVLGFALGKHINGEGKIFTNKVFTLYETSGVFMMNGFKNLNNRDLANYFFSFSVSAMNTAVEAILNGDEYSGSLGLKISKHVLSKEKNKLLQEKTLLLVDDAGGYVKDKELDEFNIKYRRIKTSELIELISQDVSQYCILYISTTFDNGNLSIFDLESKDMIYYRRFEAGGLMRLSKVDLQRIVSGVY